MKIRAGLATLAFTFGFAAGASGQTGAHAPAAAGALTPALWQLKGVHGTVYLFGTIHLMKAGVPWETPKVVDAFKKSATLYLEVPNATDPDAVKEVQPLIAQLGTDPGHLLSTKITPADKVALDAAIKSFGSPLGEASFEPFQPWLVYLTVSVMPAMKAGYDPSNGIDSQLAKQAKEEGKRIDGFETIEQQLHFLADMRQDQQVTLLHQTIQELPKSNEHLNEIVADWEHGDVDAVARLSNGEMKQKNPELYKILLVDRNEAIADRIAAMLKDPGTGTVFVALGAAHLAGADGLQAMLAKRGFPAERIE